MVKMSSFFFEDLVCLKKDASIVGTVDRTWSDVEDHPISEYRIVYLHNDLPAASRRAWLDEDTLLPGLVLIEFAQSCDGYCLISEDDLVLLDRTLTVGDIIKQKPSDVQSGVVLSTSMECLVEPTCTLHDLLQDRPPTATRHQDICEDLSLAQYLNFSDPSVESDGALQHAADTNRWQLSISARELTHWNDFREEDFLLYHNWVGKVRECTEAVSIRLTNGSVVVVEHADELEEPHYIPGSSSFRLVEQLYHAGFQRFDYGEDSYDTPGMTIYPEVFYPGLRVRTKKGNLRRGRWIFGAYDPSVPPQGIVVDARIIELKVDWLSPNVLNEKEAMENRPPPILDVDVLQRNEIILYERSRRLPKQALAPTLPQATHSCDTGFGNMVRFRDPAGTALKHADKVNCIPRTATQGYDMNVMNVIATETKILVRWQDGSISEQKASSVIPCINSDENDVWPGDKVSFKPDEVLMEDKAIPLLRSTTIGVVQSVNASERLAIVRWFEGAIVEFNADHKDWYTQSSTYGTIGEKTTEVSLYDLAAYPAFDPSLGDLSIVVLKEEAKNPSDYSLLAHFGEIVDLCLDGDAIIRCGPPDQARDIKVPASKVAIVVSSQLDEDSGTEYESESDWSDNATDSVSDVTGSPASNSPEPIKVEIEYEGGKKIGGEGEDDAMWMTDEENPPTNEPNLMEGNSTEHGPDESCPEPQNKPSQFILLDQPAPSDHHFAQNMKSLSSNVLRKIAKEHKIMDGSLPEGVFVRSWESRLDLLRILIVGPKDTPYEHAPFVIDMQFGQSYPSAPPSTFFHSWTDGKGRVNPNLYEDGKICLSLLGTWPSDERNEGWSSKSSTVLQIVVSILGLVLVREPYFSKYLLIVSRCALKSYRLCSSKTLNKWIADGFWFR